MIEKIHQKLSDSKVARWSVLALAAFTMLCGYFLTDVMAPLKPMLEEQLSWTSTEYGWVHQRLRLVQRISLHVDHWWYRSG